MVENVNAALGRVLHHSPGLQCRKRAHIYRPEITSFNELEFKMACFTAIAMSSLWSRNDWLSIAFTWIVTCGDVLADCARGWPVSP